MRPVLALTVLVALTAIGPARPGAQQPSNPRETALKSALRNLVVAQEAYFANHGTYTTDVSALGLYARADARTDSIWIQVIQAGGRSWSGRAIHRALRTKSCAIFVGYLTDFPAPPVTDGDSIRVTVEGQPTCDRM
jgi:hypothetical protein